MNIVESKAKLMNLQSKLSAYEHAMGLMFYDGATTAPKGTAANRGHSLSILSEEVYKLSTSEETVALLEELDNYINSAEGSQDPECDDKLKRMVFLMIKDIRQMQKIPMDEYVAYQELLVEADDVWHRAKESSDFELYRPVLEKIFETNIRFAKYCAPDKAAYDYWLGEYEPGVNMEILDEFFGTLKSRLVPLIKSIQAAEQVDDSCVTGSFSNHKQHELARYLMEFMQIDTDHCGFATTEHPFTTSLGSHFDERITTNYKKHNFSSSMYSVIHEGGHALYDMGSDESLAYTVLDGGVSMGIHESQSRFYENLIGRSLEFISSILPKVTEIFPSTMTGVTAEEFYKAVNKSETSLIRTEADEVTYCLHVMIRYEIEKRAMAGVLEVKDFPAEWNRLYKEYLGVEVPDDKHGVLQDSHWSGGTIGYFPSYALGSAYGAQFLKKMQETVDVKACLLKGDMAPINAWNKEQIWKYGSLQTPSQILDRVLGEKFDPTVYMDYLENKYKAIYGIN